MRIVCTGSRHWINRAQLEEVLNKHLQEFLEYRPNYHLEVAHGASKGGGADRFVADWCWENRQHVKEWPFPVVPDVDGRHRGAPLSRNERMVSSVCPDLVIGFRSEGKSNGTDHTIHYARRMGFPVAIYNEERPTLES